MEPIVINPNQPKTENETVNPSADSGTPITVRTTAPAPAAPNVVESNPAAPSTDSPMPADAPVVPAPPETPEPSGSDQVPPATIAPAQPDKPHKSKKGLLILLVLLLLAVAGGVFAYFKINKLAQPAVSSADQSKKEIAELKIGTTYTPFTNLYPSPDFVNSTGSFSATLQLYEGLVGFKDATSISPLLAESWTNPDDNTWVFKLKENVKFHTGKTMTAEDVKKSIDRAVSDPKSIPLLVSTIDSVTVQDATHVVIKTKTPDAILLNKLVYLFIQSDEKVNGVLAGTGAYTFASNATPSDKELHLVAFDDYHLGKPSVRKVTYLGFDDDPQMLDAVKQNKIDISDLFLRTTSDTVDISGYKKDSNVDGFISYLGINTADTKSPLSKLPVRQALRLALDPQAIITAIKSNGTVASQITIPDNFGYNPDIKPVTRDVAKAKELLKEAGYSKGVTLKYSYGKSDANTVLFEEVKKQAAEAGITLTPDPQDSFTAYVNNIAAGKVQVYSLSSASALLDSYDLFAYNFQNANFKNTEFDNLLTKTNASFNAEERKKLLQQASKMIIDEVAAIPLYSSRGVYYTKDGIDFKADTGSYLPGGYIRNISAK